MAKKYDLAVKVGSYTDRSGVEKNRYKNIGAVMTGNDGNEFMLLDRTFNPAGVPVEPGRDNIIISMFAPRDSEQKQEESPAYYKDKSNIPSSGDVDDEIPF